MTILVLVPTRGRPQAAADLAYEFARTTVLDDTRLLFVVDEDDPKLQEYQRTLGFGQPILVNPERVRIGPLLNKVATMLTGEADIVGFMGDDHRPRTKGWDQEVDRVLGQPGVAYGNDLIHGDNLPTAAFVSSSLITALGYMVPPGLLHMYLDNFWKQLGVATRLRYLPNVVIEHLHPLAGKADWDAQYAEVNELMGVDGIEYERYMREDWPAARASLKVLA